MGRGRTDTYTADELREAGADEVVLGLATLTPEGSSGDLLRERLLRHNFYALPVLLSRDVAIPCDRA